MAGGKWYSLSQISCILRVWLFIKIGPNSHPKTKFFLFTQVLIRSLIKALSLLFWIIWNIPYREKWSVYSFTFLSWDLDIIIVLEKSFLLFSTNSYVLLFSHTLIKLNLLSLEVSQYQFPYSSFSSLLGTLVLLEIKLTNHSLSFPQALPPTCFGYHLVLPWEHSSLWPSSMELLPSHIFFLNLLYVHVLVNFRYLAVRCFVLFNPGNTLHFMTSCR